MANLRFSYLLLVAILATTAGFSQQLEIHYINVSWGSSVLVKGPDGTTVLLEAGNTGKGTSQVVPYLQSIGLQPASGLDYTVAGHQHCDHIGGLDEVINAGYNVRQRNYYNGNASYASGCVDGWNAASASTTAGSPVAMTVGTEIPLGNGAKLTCIAAKGQIIGGGSVSVSNENDNSIAVLIQYGGFDYLWASDLGGGSIDQSCTGRSTTQVDVETAVVQAISPGGAFPLISSGGVDVLNVNHHGSESSTNNNWFDYSAPAVAVIPTGAGQTTGWDLPRIDVVHNVLLGNATSCVEAPPTFILQTEEGSPTGSLTSFEGYCVGNIKITTDGLNLFTVYGDGDVTQGPNEVASAGLPRSFTLDDSGAAPDTEPPTTSITNPASGATVSNSITVTASATDNVGVARVEFYLDGALKSTDTTGPFEWLWDTRSTLNGSHNLQSKAYDAANNAGTSAAVTVTVNNVTGTDVSNWKLVQANATNEYIVPGGTVIPDHGYLVIGRNATRAAFEAFWGVTLGSNVIYINSADGMPVINGDENYTLYNAGGTKVDGRTVNMAASAGESLQRKDPCNSSSKSTSWNRLADSAATPGTGAGAGCGGGVKINEFSDASGTGNFIYEFIELHNDK